MRHHGGAPLSFQPPPRRHIPIERPFLPSNDLATILRFTTELHSSPTNWNLRITDRQTTTMLEDARTYRSATVESHRRPTPNDTPTMINADDSIVLSDLVRSGEASRLRRRGAMRLDRNSLASGHAYHHRHLSFESEFDDESHSSDGWTSRPHSRWLGGVTEHEESDDEAEYVLVCGAEVDGECYFDDLSGPYEPSILLSTTRNALDAQVIAAPPTVCSPAGRL
ncbi:hypothetical protein NMY22_g15287 [Coprinellus aureogranulatus]|nr:hypothetical protein NMY22_g15287 [Coprinellus aureogranulatus]